MATKRADPDSDGAALFSMDDLRARLDAPLFHRDQGLATPAQLPRLHELSFDHAEVPLPLSVPVAVSAEVAVVPPPAPTPPERPKLASFSELMSSTAVRKEPELQSEPVPVVVARQPEPAMPLTNHYILW